MDEALCRGKHEDIWFPPLSGERSESEDKYYDIAKMVCEHCPVQDKCLNLGWDEEYGVWGGTTPKERRDGAIVKQSEYRLIPRYLDKVPEHSPDIKLDIVALKTHLKRYSDRRQP